MKLLSPPSEEKGSKMNESAKSAKFLVNQEREFQLRMLEVQRGYDTLNSFITTVQTATYSFIAAIITIIFTVKVSGLVQTILIIAIVVAIIIGGASNVILIRFHKETIKKQIDHLRNEFVLQK